MNERRAVRVKVALAMKLNLPRRAVARRRRVPFLALVLSGALVGCSTVNMHPVAGSNTKAVVTYISRIRMNDDRNGWAQTADRLFVGNDWTAPDECILRTTDGGRSWKAVLPAGSGQCLATCFFNSNAAWVASAVEEDTNLTIFRTSDGGHSWTRAHVFQSEPITDLSLSFADARHGWLMLIPDHGANSSPGYLYRTVDGGSQWREINSTEAAPEGLDELTPDFMNPQAYLVCGGEVSFRDDSTGWVAGSLASTTPAYLFITRNRGQSWQLEPLRMPPQFTARSIPSLWTPEFFPPDNKDGVLSALLEPADSMATNFATVIYNTHDGGLTWQPTTPLIFDDVWSFISARNGWMWSPEPHDTDSIAPGKGTLYRTDDGGESWQVVPAGKGLENYLTHGEIVVELDFVDAKFGWAIARDQHGLTQVLRTRDGGKTWNRIRMEVQQ